MLPEVSKHYYSKIQTIGLVKKHRKKKIKKALHQVETNGDLLVPELGSPVVRVSMRSTRRSFRTLVHPTSSSNDRFSSTSSSDSNTKTKKSIRQILLKSLKRREIVHPVYKLSYTPWESSSHISTPKNANGWVPDTASRRCQLCLVSFSLTRRRHHCRLCGLLVCGACSDQRTYIPLAQGKKEKILKAKRTCTSCGNTLKNMALQGDKRVHKLSFQHADEDETEQVTEGGVDSADELCLSPAMYDRTLMSPSIPYQQHGHHPKNAKDRSNRTDELNAILAARNFSKGRSASNQYIISTEWLEQWLQYVNIDSAISLLGSRSSTLMNRPFPRRQLRTKRPGPISNYSLLDFLDGKLTPKENLKRTVGDENGHYHIISQEIWQVFRCLYGGGPSIKLQRSGMSPYSSPGRRSIGYIVMDPSDWSISEATEDRLTSRMARWNRHSTHKPKRLHRLFFSRPRGVSYSVEDEQPLKNYSSGETSSTATDTTGAMSCGSPTDDSGDFSSSPISRDSPATRLSQRKSSWHNILHPSKLPKARGRSSSTQQLRRFCSNNDLRKATSVSQSYSPSHVTYADEEEMKEYVHRDTIAAVSAFAEAASEARKKSAMCLTRRSSAALMARSSSVSSMILTEQSSTTTITA